MTNKEQFEAIIKRMEKTLGDCNQRRDEYAETVGARWGEEFGEVVRSVSAATGVMAKLMGLLVRFDVLPDKAQHAITSEIASVTNFLINAALMQRFQGDPRADEQRKCVGSLLEKMIENEIELTDRMLVANDQLNELMNKEN